MSTQRDEWADKLAGWRDDAQRIRDELQGPDRPSPTTRKGRNVKATAVDSMTGRLADTIALLLRGLPLIDDAELYRQASHIVGCVGRELDDSRLKRDPVTLNLALGALQNVAAAMGHHKGLGTPQAGEGIERALQYQGAMLQALAMARDPDQANRSGADSKAQQVRQLADEHPDLSGAQLRQLPGAPDIDERAFRRNVMTSRRGGR